ncbi:hypothetical protein JAAARDRAFT_64882 [Jaapia argillacea MUCL 33604]|uniref:DNA repair protein RAD16 n=1 Tax=Jaapia argillacea MUCL 33604 TaxID=933084 RepID=A0A067QDF7_9AGAM|nr:hypothetical protein JAAARDRAFT_64882 [Jaapia argillacea MUCL 33604]
MPRTTRQKSRKVSPPSPPQTPSTNVSPIFSTKTSEQSVTPDTSVNGQEEDVKKPTTRSNGTQQSKKRIAESDDELEQTVARGTTKRRAISHQAYVEITVAPRKAKGASQTNVATPTSAKGKGKAPIKSSGKATAKAEVGDDDDVSDEGLDYDEVASIDESDASGSEFEISDDAASAGGGYESEESVPLRVTRRSPTKNKKLGFLDEDNLDESEDEMLMVDAAIQLSLQNARAGPNGSSGSRLGASSELRFEAAALAAAAAERRAKMRQGGDMVDFGEAIWEEQEAELSSLSEGDSDAPLAKGKGKSKSKAGKKKTTARDTSTPKMMTMMSLRELRKQQRLEAKIAKQDEAELRKQLGRRLTHAEKSSLALRKHHPELKDVWGELEGKVVVVTPKKAEQPEGLKARLLPFQLESLYWMRKQEQGPNAGGILADEMGMGKTIQIISLLVSDPKRPNLVVAPTVAIMQWRNEIATHTTGMNVLVWHGHGRESDIKELKKYDVVLTTYAVLESCFRKQHSGFKRKGERIKEKSPVHSMQWQRVVLDEAHNIKERSTNTAKAAFELKSNYKWCLSGTPLQNRVGELYSLIRFLGVDPFAFYFCRKCDCKSLHWKFSDKKTCDGCGHTPMQHTCFWNNEVLSPIQKNGMQGPGAIAFKKLRVLLDRLMLRRTKIERADDLGLPPRTVIVRRDYFSPEEKELYLSLFSDAKRQFNTYLDSGTVLNNYSNIFSLLTRMRQMACHPDLVIRSKNNQGKFTSEDEGEATVCRLCNDIAEDAIQSKCRHIFDRECIKQYLNTAIEMNPQCPVCHLPLTIDLEAPALELAENVATTRQGILGRLNLDTWRSSTKIEALVEELSNLRGQDSTVKSIVFSQFVNFLDLIAFRLQKAGFNICRLEGTMSPQARDATIKHFMNNVHVTVFLVSLKAGGVALNLTEASRVYLMDSWWNPAVEFQAMDRIHRLGQRRPVQAIKLVVEDSIESRIVQLQEKKSAMVDATLSTDDSAMGRLTPDDLGFLFRL